MLYVVSAPEVETFAVIQRNGGMSRLRATPNNQTYTVHVDRIPTGDHKLVVYAHNPVGWSPALRDDQLILTVVNAANKMVTSLISLVLALAMIKFI